MKSIWLYLILPLLTVITASGQGTIAIDVTNGPAATSDVSYLNGYSRALDGGSISYHSVHPDAEDALLVRANSEAPSISWQTDTIPATQAGNAHHFVWLAGIERIGWGNATTPHRFRFSVNGVEALTFTNRKDSTATNWRINNGHGVELRFESGLSDKYGDLFGYMYLTLAKELCPTGKPVTLRITGVDAGSPEWVMIFKHSFNFTPRLRVEPAVARGKGMGERLLRMSLDNLRAGRQVRIEIGGKDAVRDSLKLGANIFLLPFSESGKNPVIDISYSVNGAEQNRYALPVPPVHQRSIYLLPHTHNDIGYTDVQPVVEQKQWAFLEEAMTMIRQTRSYPPEARYKWNLEILWPLESWLRNASADQKAEFLADVQDGSIGLNALLVNPLTGLANSPEMVHYTDFARSLSATYGISIPTAVIDDIPGFTWGLVPALAQSGVKYFASGPNSGDRIGTILEEWGDKPFYWRSQSAKESILCWMAGSSYAAFHQNTLAKAGPERLMKLLRSLDDTDYPYDMYFIPYTLGDNHGNDTTLAAYVKEWNERYISPRLVIATHRQLFEDFEKLHGSALPTFSGDLTPYWEDGAASTAHETAVSRHAADRLLQAEALWSVRNPDRFPRSLADSSWRQVTLWDEHTWGADISVSNPDSSKSTVQWAIKRQYALDADSLSRRLLTMALPPKKNNGNAFDIWNTNSWKRSDIIILSKAQSRVGDRVIDEHGRVLASQRLQSGELAVFVKDVPPLAAIQIRVTPGEPGRPESIVTAGGVDIQNSQMRLTVSKMTGAISSLRQLPSGRELVDGSRGSGLNEYIYVPGTNADSAVHLKNVRVEVVEQGPLVGILRVTGDAPGCKAFTAEVRMTAGSDKVDITNMIDKEKVRTKEGLHFGFPFRVADGQIRYDVAAGIVRLETDQLRGSCKNFFSAVSWADVSNESGGVTLTTPDAPEVEPGAINAERPWMKSVAPSTSIYSYVMNNYWHTNYKADQEGSATFRYSIRPHGKYSPTDNSRHGIESRQPLLVAAAAPAAAHQGSPFLIDSSTVLIESIRPAENENGWLLLLYNPEGTPQKLLFKTSNGKSMTGFQCDAAGHHDAASKSSFELPGNGSSYYLLKQPK